jgi:hypothetical protein
MARGDEPTEGRRAPRPARKPRARRRGPRTPGAIRQARFRLRERGGLKPFRVVADENRLAEALILSGRLDAEATADQRRVDAALAAIVAEFCTRWIEGREA